MNKNILPKAKFFSNPFVLGFIETDQENISFTIGKSLKNATFTNEDYFPEYIKCFCNIVPRMKFNNVTVETSYIDNSSGLEIPERFSIYSGEEIQMKGFVSELDFECYEVLSDSKIPQEIFDFLSSNKKIFTKKFVTQQVPKNIETFVDGNSGYQSKAHFFAGSYFCGINLRNIEQYMFYVGIDAYQQKYINIISATELLNSTNIFPSDEIRIENLSNIKDDVLSGRLKLKISDEIVYKAVDISKETLISDKCLVLFKKDTSWRSGHLQ